jgi:glutamine cyclotransferase
MISCKKEKETQSNNPTVDPLAIEYSIKTTWAHDPGAFIQGLVIHNGQLYESTGRKQSWLGIIDVKTGKPDKKVILDDQYFGEGITILNNKIYQLTWQNKKGFVYDLKTFKKLRDFDYETEGWGITHDDQFLIMSDGTDKLIYLDTVSFKPVKTLYIKDEKGLRVNKLNELEYVEGFIFANVWETNTIVKIDPKTEKIVGRLNLTSLMQDSKMRNSQSDVLNGIAYHPGTKLLLVTGKLWPRIYVLQLKK